MTMAFLIIFAIMAGFIVFFVITVMILVHCCNNTTGYNIQVQQTTDNVITDN